MRRPRSRPDTGPSSCRPPWSEGCESDERAGLDRGRGHRRRRVAAPLLRRRPAFLGRRAGLPARHDGDQRVRRGRPRAAERAGTELFAVPAARHRGRRLVYDLLHLDAGDAAAHRGAAAPQGGAQHRGQPGARHRRGRARTADRDALVIEDSLKLTSYFGERQRTADNGFAADALLDLYGRRGIATSILLRGAEGFGAGQRLRTDVSLSLSEDLPLTAVAVDTRSRIEGLLDSTADLLRSGLVTLERARLLTGDLAGVGPGKAPDEE